MKQLFELFISFARIGAFTFGGGYAMLPMIEKEIVEKKKWATSDEILDYYANGKCKPGVIAVNTATFIGYKRKGILGAIIATLGVVFLTYNNNCHINVFRTLPRLYHSSACFRRCKGCCSRFNSSYNYKMWKQSIKDWLGILYSFFHLLQLHFLDISPVIIIILGGIIGTNKICVKRRMQNDLLTIIF